MTEGLRKFLKIQKFTKNKKNCNRHPKQLSQN